MRPGVYNCFLSCSGQPLSAYTERQIDICIEDASKLLQPTAAPSVETHCARHYGNEWPQWLFTGMQWQLCIRASPACRLSTPASSGHRATWLDVSIPCTMWQWQQLSRPWQHTGASRHCYTSTPQVDDHTLQHCISCMFYISAGHCHSCDIAYWCIHYVHWFTVILML